MVLLGHHSNPLFDTLSHLQYGDVRRRGEGQTGNRFDPVMLKLPGTGNAGLRIIQIAEVICSRPTVKPGTLCTTTGCPRQYSQIGRT